MSVFKPILAAKLTPNTVLQFPVLASTKLDGIRCCIIDGIAVSRTLKPIPNKHIQELLSKPEYSGLDGEIIIGNTTDPDCFRRTTSAAMSHDKAIDGFTYHVFDDFSDPTMPFVDRLQSVCDRVQLYPDYIQVVRHEWILNTEELQEYEQAKVEAGNEGIMIRSQNGKYKHGRSTEKEQILLKVKRFADSEAIVLGFEELFHNDNVATIDATGHTKRTTHQANKSAAGTLGNLQVKDVITGVEFGIGTGFNAADRQSIWDDRPGYIGRILKYKYFPVGVFEKPRHPVMLGWRSAIDFGEAA